MVSLARELTSLRFSLVTLLNPKSTVVLPSVMCVASQQLQKDKPADFVFWRELENLRSGVGQQEQLFGNEFAKFTEISKSQPNTILQNPPENDEIGRQNLNTELRSDSPVANPNVLISSMVKHLFRVINLNSGTNLQKNQVEIVSQTTKVTSPRSNRRNLKNSLKFSGRSKLHGKKDSPSEDCSKAENNSPKLQKIILENTKR